LETFAALHAYFNDGAMPAKEKVEGWEPDVPSAWWSTRPDHTPKPIADEVALEAPSGPAWWWF
jgi:hypothetical protein